MQRLCKMEMEKQSVFSKSSNTQMCGYSSNNSELKGIWSAVIPKIFCPYWHFMCCSFSYQYPHQGDILSPLLNSLAYRCDGSGQWIAESTWFQSSAECGLQHWQTPLHACVLQGISSQGKGNVTTEPSTLKKILVLITPGINWNLSPSPVQNLAHLCHSQICCALQMADRVSLDMKKIPLQLL